MKKDITNSSFSAHWNVSIESYFTYTCFCFCCPVEMGKRIMRFSHYNLWFLWPKNWEFCPFSMVALWQQVFSADFATRRPHSWKTPCLSHNVHKTSYFRKISLNVIFLDRFSFCPEFARRVLAALSEKISSKLY